MQAPLDQDISELTGKAADRRFLEGLQPVIERAAREGHEREKLKSAPKAQRRVARESEKPWLDRDINVPTGKYRDEQKMQRFAEQVSVFADKQRRNAARRNARVADEPIGPTQERYFRGGEGIDAITPPIGSHAVTVGIKAHIVRRPIDTDRDRIGDRRYDAALRFLRDYDAVVLGTKRIIADLDSVGGGSFGPRHGGVTDSVRESAARLHLLQQLSGNEIWRVLEQLVAQTHDVKKGRPVTVEEFGHELTGYSRDQARSAGVAAMALALSFVVNFYRREDALSRGDVSTAEEIRARLQIRRERLERERRDEERKRATTGGGR